jgi:hypothetical protein
MLLHLSRSARKQVLLRESIATCPIRPQASAAFVECHPLVFFKPVTFVRPVPKLLDAVPALDVYRHVFRVAEKLTIGGTWKLLATDAARSGHVRYERIRSDHCRLRRSFSPRTIQGSRCIKLAMGYASVVIVQ